MENKYRRLEIIALIILILGLYALTVQSTLAKSSPPTKLMQVSQIEITGTVTDANGVPLPGVTIAVKGENRGTITDLDGNYDLEVKARDTLIFSHIGFKTVEEPVNGRSEINIWLEEDISALQSVEINAGYYSTTRRESTGNISRVTAEEIEMQPVVSPLLALQGRMAGVEIIPGGSHPGMAATIRIRGRNSLRDDGNLPLYIIDGVPVSSTPLESNSLLELTGIDPLSTLNLSSIASIEVLKDADATAIYGSRGANGVVLITTKKGHSGKISLEAQVYTGASIVPNRLELLNTEQYVNIRRQAFENDGVEPTANNAYDLVLWNQERYTDWQDFIFGGTAETTNASMALSGGKENTFFRLAGSYFTKGTVYPGEYDYQKITGNINFSHTSEDKKFSFNFMASYGVDVNNLVSNLGLNSNAYLLPPNAPPIFNDDGGLNWDDWAEARLNNPLAGFFNTTNINSNSLISNLSLNYKIGSGLSLKSNLGYTTSHIDELWRMPKRSNNPMFNYNHNAFYLKSSRESWIIEPQLFYNLTIGNFQLESILGATFQVNINNRTRFQGSGYPSEALIGNLSAAEQIINAATSKIEYRYNAIFARLGMNWDKKYYLNLTGRRDGSSRFGPDKRFANFGAIGAAWIFTEEDVVENSFPFLSFGKLRGSYGTTGNDQIGDYGYLDAYEATRGPNGLYPTALANSEYSWEVNKKLEAAIELGFLRDRINFSFSWYRNRSSNQLVGYPLPAITGFSIVQANLPATVENTGWEMEGSFLNFDTKNFRWKTFFNITIPKNELVSYPELEQSAYSNKYRIGHPLNISLLYKYEGLDPETGFYTVKDVNSDGRFDHEDRIVIHDQNKEFFLGVNNNLIYKDFSLQFLWQFVKQDGSLGLFNTGQPSNLREIALESLSDDSRFQTVSQSSLASIAYNRVINSDFTIEDASFLRLKTLSFAYSLPKSLVQRMGGKTLKLFIHGQNLLTITPYDGLDPAFSYAGTAFGNYRTITGGLQLIF